MIRQVESVLGSTTSAFPLWEQTCDNIERQLKDHVMRIAVVGAIKSGKSTLVNALLRNDYLKRGAGVVTSIVTRIRQGEDLRARLYFKSWDEVNADIQQALVLFPSEQWQTENQSFDIRRSKDRGALTQGLEVLDSELRVAQDGLNANGVLLSSYLKGYERVQEFVAAESVTREFDGDHFGEHRAFVGDDALAVYLKDLKLEITGNVLSSNLEIADCQGSDSPNPLHMAMIQDYLLKAHLIIYVISSRTGLRQADIRFLSVIKRMGIGDNILFVCNCDFNEHDALEDLQGLIARMEEELDIMVPQPQLFAFSALFNLFNACQTQLSSRDKERLAQWRKSRKLVAFSNDQTKGLQSVLERKLTLERSVLLLQNQLERLDVMTNGLHQWIHINCDLLQRDAGDARNVAQRLQHHQSHVKQVQTMIHSTLVGATQKIKRELKKRIDAFFDRSSGTVLNKIISYVRNYSVDLSIYRDRLGASGFTHTLYLVFQDFKQAVDGYMAEKVNPDILGFFNQLESRLKDDFTTVAEPFEAMVRNALAQYEEALMQVGLNSLPEKGSIETSPDLTSIKQAMGLSLPPAAATLHYSAHIKTEAVMRLGFYALLRLFGKVLKKPVGTRDDEELKAILDSTRRMKRETERSIIAHFKDYQENVKFQYMMRLADATSERMYEALADHFRTHATDLKDLIALIGREQSDKEQVHGALKAIEDAVELLNSNVKRLRQEVLQMRCDSDITDANAGDDDLASAEAT